MIEWLGEHDETNQAGATGRFRIGRPSAAFWEDFEKNPGPWKAQGYEAFATTSGKFVKVPTGKLVEPPCAGVPVPRFASFLRDFQHGHCGNIWNTLSIQTSVGDFSDTGTGKTFTTLALALELGLPLFVVCKLAGMAKWIKLSQKFGVKVYGIGNYEYFKGENEFGVMEVGYYPLKIWNALVKLYDKDFTTPPFPKQKVFTDYKECLDYFFSKTIFRPKHCEEFESKSGKSVRLLTREIRGYQWKLPKKTMFVFDEVHKCKSEDSQNMRLLVAAKPYVTFGLTATPGITPRDFKALGYVLGLHRLYDFDVWTEGHGCRRVYTQGKTRKFIGWDYAKKSGGIETLNKELFPLRAARMRISEIPGFPETSITAEAFSASEAPKLREAYAACVKACRDQVGKNKMIQVTAILRYRMFAEKMKVPLFISLIEEAIEGGYSVAVFVNFKETLALLKKKFPEAPLVYGKQKGADREAGRQAFEDNQVNKIFLNMEAGGDSLDLHDIHGGHPRMAFIAPTYNPYTLKQVFGRVHRDGALTKSIQRIVYMADTQEEKVCEDVREKLQAFSTINGDEVSAKDLIEEGFQKILNDDVSLLTEGIPGEEQPESNES